MKIELERCSQDWQFRVEYMDVVISGRSFDQRSAEDAIERSRKFLLDMATRGIKVVEGCEAPQEERL